MIKFHFFRGMVGARVVSIQDTLDRLNRLPRTPIAHIPVPEYAAALPGEYRRAFINGWRACEFGSQIYDCPDLELVELKREWEYGFTECYNSRRTATPTDEDCYLAVWESAQQGRPNNDNPYNRYYGNNTAHQRTMWDCGWNDFINDH